MAQETLSNVRTVRSFAAERHEVSRYWSRVDESYRLGVLKAVAYGFFMGGAWTGLTDVEGGREGGRVAWRTSRRSKRQILWWCVGVWAGIGAVSYAAMLLVLWYGGTQVIEGTLSPGTLTSFLLYTVRSGNATTSAWWQPWMALVMHEWPSLFSCLPDAYRACLVGASIRSTSRRACRCCRASSASEQ